MAARDLIVELERLGVQMWAEGGQLRFRAPKGVLTQEWLALLKASKQELLTHLDGAAAAVTADPAARHEPFPLTDVQSAYLLGRHDAFAYGGVACHGYFEVAFAQLDPATLESAWRRLIARHDMLRAVVSRDGHQQVLPDLPAYQIEVTDLRQADQQQVESTLEAIREELSHKVYDAQQWPLFTLRITRTPDHDLLHFSIDLLISDYASIQILLAELDKLYLDPDAVLPQLDISFRDHLLADRAARQSPAYEADRAWWEQRLDQLPPAPELPVADHPSRSAPRFRRWQMALDSTQWTQLRQQAVDRKVTAAGALLGAYAEVIGRWSRRPRFTLNLTLLNRPPLHPQVAQLVGDFTSVTLLEVNPAADDFGAASEHFAARAARLQEQLWQDLDHRRFSGVEVLREVARRRGADAALLPVVFTSTIGLADETIGAGGLTGRGELLFGLSQTPQVWIDCQVMEQQGQLLVHWDVREGVFPDGLIDDMFDAYATLIKRLATGDAWESRWPVPLPADQVQRRAEVNATASDVPQTLLHAPLLAQAERTPDRIAVLTDDRCLTYRELVHEATRVAQWLRTSGCGPAEPVAVIMDKGWEQVVAVLGVLMAGGAYVPLDTNQPPARRSAMLSAAGARFVLTQSWLGLTHPASLAVDTLPASAVAAQELPPSVAEPDDLAYIIFTSGSTGSPKGVMVSHRAALNTVLDINQRFGVDAEDRVLGLANLGFDLSVYDIFGLLAVGGALVLPGSNRRGDPSHWADLVDRHRVTLWNSVPAQLQMLHDYLVGEPQMTLPSLRLALLSGDWIPVALPDAIRSRVPGMRVISLGGATEAAIWSIHYPIETVPAEWRSIPYGFPLANQTFHVLNEELQDCPDWVSGELHIGGVGLALGYLDDPERTAQQFITHPTTSERLYRTGDLGRYLPDGALEFLGREDSQVKIRGHRIELAEIDTALTSYPDISAAATMVEGAGPMERRLAAFVEPRRRPAPPEVAAATARVADAADRAGAETVAMAATTEDATGSAMVAAVAALDRAALRAMLAALQESGVFVTTQVCHDLDDVLNAAQVAPRHHRLVRRWLRALTTEGLLVADADADGWRLADEARSGPDGDWDQVAALAEAHGYGSELVGYLRLSAQRLPELLRDELDPLALLFPEGRLDVAQAAYQENVISRYLNATLAAALRTIAVEHPPGRPLAVLEVGAGVGGTTNDLVRAVEGLPVDYLFTDLSGFFLDEARQHFAESAWIRYGLFDLNRDYREQGLPPHSFDVVVCANVLHNSRHAGEVLGRLSELIRPGGWLLFIEATRDNYPLMASMEFKEGLTDFTDERLAADRTFHTRQAWQEMVGQLDADLAFCLPVAEHPLSAVGQHAFAARIKPHVAPVDPARLHAHLSDRLPDYMLPGRIQMLDALPLTDNGKIDRAKLSGWLADTTSSAGGDTGTAPQTDLEQRLATLWADLLAVPQIGRDADFYSLGGDSLLVSKLVSQVRDRVPEAAGQSWDVLLRQMLRTPTVAGFAEWLTQDAATGSAGEATTRPTSPLVTLRGSADHAGLARVLVHDGSGTLSPYRALIPALTGETPLIGVEIHDVESYLRYDSDVLIARLAADYAGELAASGHDQFEIVGYCLGGLLATEIARQLTEAGADVNRLTVLSSYRVPYQVEDDLIVEYAFARLLSVDPAVLGYPADEHLLGRALGVVLADSPDRLPAGAFGALTGDAELREIAARFRDLSARPAADRIAAIAAVAGDRFGDSDVIGSIERGLSVFRHGLAAVTRHQSEPYAGDITFVRQRGELHFLPGLSADMTDYWRQVCLGDLRVVDVPGDHFSCLRPPHVTSVAAALDTTLGLA